MMKPTRSWMTGLGLKTLATLLLSTLLISCGSSKKYDEFIPTRIVSAGDGMSYLGVGPGYANPLTVTEDGANAGGTYDHWLRQFAAGYGLTTISNSLSSSAQIITLSATAPTLGLHAASPNDVTLAQIQAQLNGVTPRADDLLVLSVGMGDVLEFGERYLNNNADTSSSLQALAYSRGQAYMDYVNSLYQNGVFKRIILVNPIDIKNSPYAQDGETRRSGFSGSGGVLDKLTEQLTFGILNRASAYPRTGGVWLFNAYTRLSNITTGTGLVVNLTTAVCDQVNSQSCSVEATKVAQDTGTAGRTSNAFTNLSIDVLPLSTTSGNTALYPTNAYYFAGSIFPTPYIHRYMGSLLYNQMRSTIGF